MRAPFSSTTLLAVLLGSILAAAPVNAKGKEGPSLRYSPTADVAEERPLPVELTVSANGIDYALHIVFNREPWGEACQNRCANATLFLDTDNSRSTGLQLGKGVAETGADLAISIQGVRDFKETGPDTRLRVKVRQLGRDAKTADDGNPFAELDPRRDPERLQTKHNDVWIRLDATDPMLPSGKTMRLIYHPPASKVLEASMAGMLAGSAHAITVVGPGGKKKSRR